MPVRVLVVDDSRFFRRRVVEILQSDPGLEVVGSAENGADAIDQVNQLKPDVVTMDIEMPVMDGITAVRRIMQARPTPILMFSSLTTEGAQATLDALEAGAVDFLPKRFEDISKDREEAKRLLCNRVRALGAKGLSGARPRPAPTTFGRLAANAAPAKPVVQPPSAGASFSLSKFKLVAIGTSTGGPVALQEVLTKLPSNFPLPILLVQHMPATFTTAFAARLDKLCQINVKEAVDGDRLRPGLALLAPGGRQMVAERRGADVITRIREPDPGQTYKPSVDVTFTSIANIFGGQVLAIVLTGMGADGREGATLLKRGGSSVWAQNQETCVVFGMPGAVVEAGLADQILPLPEVGLRLAQGV